LSSHREIDLHITLDGVNAVINWFWSHPFHRRLLCILSTVHVFIDLSHQPKVWDFDSVITANQNITSCQVTMNEAFLCEMILKHYEGIKGAHLLKKRLLLVFVFISLELWITLFEITNKWGTQDLSQFQMIFFKEPFLWWSAVTTKKYFYT